MVSEFRDSSERLGADWDQKLTAITELAQADVRLAQAEARLAQAEASLVSDILTPDVTDKLVLVLVLHAIVWLVEAAAGLTLANLIFNICGC